MIFLQTHFIYSFILLSVLGLGIGSFLNVVIARYPVMLMREWQAECRELLKLPSQKSDIRLNLAMPRSHCPHCQHHLPFHHNIPLVSFLALRGRCGFCQQRISWQYPLVELITVLTTLAVFLQFGWQVKTVALWIMTWSLIVLSGIDWKTQILPDHITLSLLWIGLILNIGALFTPLSDAVLGAVLGYVLLWFVTALFKIIRKKQGMGHGDFKMLAMFGAWLGIQAMLNLLVIAVLMSLIVNLGLLLFRKIHLDQPLPFGPWLAISGWIVFMFNTSITEWIARCCVWH